MTQLFENSIFDQTVEEIKADLFRDHMKKVKPGDEVGEMRAAKLAADQARDVYQLVNPSG